MLYQRQLKNKKTYRDLVVDESSFVVSQHDWNRANWSIVFHIASGIYIGLQ